MNSKATDAPGRHCNQGGGLNHRETRHFSSLLYYSIFLVSFTMAGS
uniref:Uncharacterized protein n=1 Tax=Rhizophora mucronata TaxID=61149 RepID=A0A2P2IJ73_RHIMU